MSNQLLVGGVALDLDASTRILPSFQASDLLKPDTIQSDFSPELSVPATQRNEGVLGNASVDGSGARVPYRVLPDVTLLSDGVDIMPRARLYLKGYSEGRYQLQLFAGNRRFIEALGEKTLRELDFSRYTHLWTLGNVAQRATAAFRAANGWGYELYDRGKPLNLSSVSPYDLYPTVSADLVWQQMLKEAGFTASDWGSELLDKLQVPAAELAVLSEAYRTARRLRVGLGPGHEDDGAPDSNRSDVVRTIPFDDDTRLIGTVPPIKPTAAGVYSKTAYSWTADRACYVSTQARAVLRLIYSEIRLGKAQARVELCVNGNVVVEGAWVGSTEKDSFTDNETYPFGVAAAAERLQLAAGDVLTARLRIAGVGSAPIDKWGYRIFEDVAFNFKGQTIPGYKWEVTVLEELAPGGEVQLNDFLPEMKQLDFFKTIIQLGGLSVRCDGYEDHLHLWPSADVLDNAPRAHDWTRLRDEPPGPRGAARKVAYRFGGFGQRNLFKWAEDESVAAGYGDGVLLVEDAQLPATYTMLTLPFAATEPSASVPGLLRIAGWKVRENEDPFADLAYDRVTPKPRLTLSTGRTISVVLIDGSQTRTVAVPTAHFADPAEPVSLDAAAYVLPENWRGLLAMLTECRYHTERYRLSQAELLDYQSAPWVPIWDGILGGYFAVVQVSEFDPDRPTEVELIRLFPAFVSPPEPGTAAGEFNAAEFFAKPSPAEFY